LFDKPVHITGERCRGLLQFLQKRGPSQSLLLYKTELLAQVLPGLEGLFS